MRRKTAFFLLCLLLLGVGSATAEERWIEVRSPHFRVLTNGSKSDASDVAHEFEQMRYLFATRFPQFRLDSGAPLTIFAVRDEHTAKMLEPGLWKMKGAKPVGEFHHGWEQQYVMVRLDVTGLDRRAVIFHEYTHSIMHLNTRWLPTWLDEGLAEFYGYTRFEPHKIYIGWPTERAAQLQKTPIPVATLIAVNQTSPYYHDNDKVDLFYAESWALVHYLVYGQGMDLGAKLNGFIESIEEGTDQKQAFVAEFGEFPQVDKALDIYMRSLTFKASVLKDTEKIDVKNFTATKLTAAETNAELAGFHLWNHDLKDARPLVAKALQEDPKLGLAHEEEGYLLFADGQDGVAKDEFSQAYALDGNLYLALFAKTMLSPMANSSAPADEAAFEDALMKVVTLNLQFAPAYAQMARLAVRRGDLQKAFGLARRAEELEPSRAGYHLLTARIELRMGKDADAARLAQSVTQHWYGPDHNEAVELWNRIPPSRRPAGVALIAEVPSNTQTATGVVKSVECSGVGADGKARRWTLVLEHDGKDMTFHTKGNFGFGFSDTLWWGEDHASTCRHLEGLRAVVRYRPDADTSYAGDISTLSIRDDLPPMPGPKIQGSVVEHVTLEK